MASRLQKLLWTGAGHMALALGIIGAFVPVLPTTPFVLLACGCYGKGSKRFHRAIRTNQWSASLIENWQKEKAISLRAKVLAVIMLAVTAGYSLAWSLPILLKVASMLLVAGIGIFILSRPLPKGHI